MTQPKLTRSGTTHLLPFPATCKETVVPKAVDHGALDGLVIRDFDQSGATSIRTYELTWEDASGAELDQIIAAYRGLADMSVWQFTTPRGSVANVTLDPEQPQLSVGISAGAGGSALYTVRLTLWTGGS